MNKPVIDEVFELIIRGELDKLEDISRPEEVLHIRSAISTENKSAVGVSVDLEDIAKRAPWITPLFLGPRIFFTSRSTVIQNAITGGKSNVPIDWYFSFDSNVAEKVRAYVNHEDINKNDLERVITLLKLKKEYSLQTDLLPFLFENLRLSRNDRNNERPLNTIVAFKKLDYLDWESFEKNPDKPKFLCDEEALLEEAVNTYEDLINHNEVKKREYKTIFTQVFLFELAILWLKNKSSPEEVFGALIDFCVLQLKKLPKYELMFAWLFLKDPNRVRFFGPLSGISKKITKALLGMAWDMSHMRTLETMSTATNMGSFFIPFFVSFDEKFSEILKQNQIQVLVIDDRLKRMHSASQGELDFQTVLRKCMSKNVLNEMTIEKSDERRSYDLPQNDLEHILYNQTMLLERLADEAREAINAKV